MGTHEEQEKKTKNKFPPPHTQNEKSRAHLGCMLSLPIGCMKIYSQNCLSPFSAWPNGRGRN